MTAPLASNRGAGRRPGSPDTRGEIVAAARREFAAKGFDKTSLRGVARGADVDPALVHHYFAGKEELFLAAMQLPFDPRTVLPPVLQGPRDGVGERLVRAVLGLWDDPALQPGLLSVARSALASEETAHLMRDGFLRMVIEQIAAMPGIDDPRRRAALAATQIVGLLVARYIVGLEPVASMPAETLARAVGPTLERYFFDAV
jgi:AcrR family transcriptional regulator